MKVGRGENYGSPPATGPAIDVRLNGVTFAELLEKKHWIVLPARSRGKETSLAACISLESNFPDNKTLPAFAATFGFSHVEARDENGKTFSIISFRQ